jgi:hypothetical protein
VITGLVPNFAGAVIFIDNEDGTSTTLPQSLIDYYNGLFTETVRPDTNLASCQPGLYGHGTPLHTMLKSLRNLYLWDVRLDTSATTTTDVSFGGSMRSLTARDRTHPDVARAAPTVALMGPVPSVPHGRARTGA